MLTFESTHEYYMGNDPSIFYCAEHGSLFITEDHQDRLLISGIKKETMLDFAQKLVSKDLDETLAKLKDKDAEDKDAAGVTSEA
mgnify:CR=1 FL=1